MANMQGGIILVGVDFEEASRKAIAVAKEIAGPLGAEIALVHVYAVPVYTYPGLEPTLLPGFQPQVVNAAKRALEELSSSVGAPRAMLREGDPAQAVLAAADELDARMIVVGTHGRRGLTHLLLGSVAEKIVRSAKVPVLTVRSET